MLDRFVIMDFYFHKIILDFFLKKKISSEIIYTLHILTLSDALPTNVWYGPWRNWTRDLRIWASMLHNALPSNLVDDFVLRVYTCCDW